MYKPVSLGTHVNIFPMQGSASFSMERANLSKLTGANLRNMGQRWGVGVGGREGQSLDRLHFYCLVRHECIDSQRLNLEQVTYQNE